MQACLVTQTMVDRLIDTDNDGYWEVGYRDGADCDDDDPLINPAAGEVCFDQLDNDCDGLTDEDGVGDQSIYLDRDRDGYGDEAASIASCFLLEGYATRAGDCDDTRADVHPSAPEACNLRDDNCNGELDDDAPGTTWFRDADADSFGDPLRSRVACEGGEGWVDRDGDCDDTNPQINPVQPELFYDGIDQDCAGTSDFDQDGDGFEHPLAGAPVPDCDDLNAQIYPGAPEAWYDHVDQDCAPANEYDADADGHDAAPWGGDCDDSTSLIAPGNAETWYDGIDQDCDPSTEWDRDGDGHGAAGTPHPLADDCDDSAVAVGPPLAWYLDADQDGWGLHADVLWLCGAPPGRSLTAGDCDDARATVYPTSVEVCGGLDEDCDGLVDEGVGELVWPDADRDGFGAPGQTTQVCAPGVGWAFNALDCDDTTAQRSPAAGELCNLIDDDCDAVADDGVGGWYFPDADLDGAGRNHADAQQLCFPGPGWAATATDCDDTSALVRPGLFDGCDQVDNDCDVSVDEDGVVDLWADADADGFGDASAYLLACPSTPGFVRNPADCDDADPAQRPGAEERCDATGEDDDCDGEVDEFLRELRYLDVDGDGFASNAAIEQRACIGEPGWTTLRGDCDDADPGAFPGAAESCDLRDEDCDGDVDEGLRADLWLDLDRDGFGDGATLPQACLDTPNAVSVTGDCDDADPSTFPGAPETCDREDDDCDGVVDDDLRADLWYDADGDGWGAGAMLADACRDLPDTSERDGDCDDAAPRVHPGAFDACNLLDDDCDGVFEEDEGQLAWPDQDADGRGAINQPQGYACAPFAGWSLSQDDCDDDEPTVFAGAIERCDRLDNNCNAAIDEGLVGPRFRDDDRDGFGAGRARPDVCLDDAAFADAAGDCEPSNPAIHPGAAEVCDRVDNNCDLQIDEGVATRVWPDVDRDGFGDAQAAPSDVCQVLAGQATRTDDCDDANRLIHPNAPEICDDVDNNCDGLIDPNLRGLRYADTDGDLHHGTAVPDACLDDPALEPLVSDCDESDCATWVGAPESCDGRDNDCDPGTPMDWPNGDALPPGAQYSSTCAATRIESGDHVYLIPQHVNNGVPDRPLDLSWYEAIDWCQERGYRLWRIDDALLAPLGGNLGFGAFPEEIALARQGWLPPDTSFWTATTVVCPADGRNAPANNAFHYDSDAETCEMVGTFDYGRWGPVGRFPPSRTTLTIQTTTDGASPFIASHTFAGSSSPNAFLCEVQQGDPLVRGVETCVP